MERLARRKGITLDQLLQRHNLTLEDFMVDVPLKDPPPNLLLNHAQELINEDKT